MTQTCDFRMPAFGDPPNLNLPYGCTTIERRTAIILSIHQEIDTTPVHANKKRLGEYLRKKGLLKRPMLHIDPARSEAYYGRLRMAEAYFDLLRGHLPLMPMIVQAQLPHTYRGEVILDSVWPKFFDVHVQRGNIRAKMHVFNPHALFNMNLRHPLLWDLRITYEKEEIPVDLETLQLDYFTKYCECLCGNETARPRFGSANALLFSTDWLEKKFQTTWSHPMKGKFLAYCSWLTLLDVSVDHALDYGVRCDLLTRDRTLQAWNCGSYPQASLSSIPCNGRGLEARHLGVSSTVGFPYPYRESNPRPQVLESKGITIKLPWRCFFRSPVGPQDRPSFPHTLPTQDPCHYQPTAAPIY